MKTLWRALALATILAGAIVVPAQASDAPTIYAQVMAAPNPAVAYAQLSKADKAAFRLYVTPSNIVVTRSPLRAAKVATALATAVSCKTEGNAVAAYNMWGGELWQWDTIVEWCFNGISILYSDVRTAGHTYVPFWSWGNASKSKALNPFTVPNKLTVQTQAEFKLCLFSNIGCTNYMYPWFTVKVYGNGVSSWNGGNN